jgi:hypothetical protein
LILFGRMVVPSPRFVDPARSGSAPIKPGSIRDSRAADRDPDVEARVERPAPLPKSGIVDGTKTEAMTDGETWMGRPIRDMTRDELAAALRVAVHLLRSTAAPALRPEVDVKETAAGTTVGRTFNWAFLPAGQLWSEADRAAVQERLDAFAAGHGLAGAVVHFGPDRLDVEVPGRLQAEQIMALQDWLEGEREALDVSQVP